MLWLAGALGAQADDRDTDPTAKHAWAENVGWLNAAPTNAGQTVVVHFDGDMGWLSGQAWGENIGWISMGSEVSGPYANTGIDDWGVNWATNGDLSGYAWGENVGWINFGHAQCDAAINPATGEFSGHAWGENIGWLKFKGAAPAFGVRTRAFDTQPQGTPNWWLGHYGVTEGHDAGDGVPAWQKYVMDVSPTATGNFLRITAESNSPSARVITFTPASTRRYYTLTRRTNLTAGAWSNVAGQAALQYGTVGAQTMQDTNVGAGAFYSVRVTVAP